MRQVAIVSLIGLWILFVVGCQMSGVGGQANESTPRPQATNAPTPKGTDSRIPAGAEAQVARARQDLASRLGVSAESISVVRVEEVEWPDTSLGCPEPGKMYAQVITPGYRIILEAAEKEYEYHADKGKSVVFCSR